MCEQRRMLKHGCAVLALVAPLLAIAACDATETGDEEYLTQKTGVASLAPEIGFGETVSGLIDKKQLDLYGMDLREGDKITIEASVTDGDAKPDVTLFLGGNSKVSSKSFDANAQKLSKQYVIDAEGTYVFAVRAFKGEKSGRYTLKITCTGGPCKGEPFVKPLEADEAGACIAIARECAFDKLPSFKGVLGPVKARAAFEDCIAKGSLTGGTSCARACDGDVAQSICDSEIGLLPFFADQSKACLDEFEDCMDSCYDAGGNEQGLEDGPEQVCLSTGFNNTCDSYARGHKLCGGGYESGSAEQCHALCESTFGAWNDDLDDICTMECGDLP